MGHSAIAENCADSSICILNTTDQSIVGVETSAVQRSISFTIGFDRLLALSHLRHY